MYTRLPNRCGNALYVVGRFRMRRVSCTPRAWPGRPSWRAGPRDRRDTRTRKCARALSRLDVLGLKKTKKQKTTKIKLRNNERATRYVPSSCRTEKNKNLKINKIKLTHLCTFAKCMRIQYPASLGHEIARDSLVQRSANDLVHVELARRLVIRLVRPQIMMSEHELFTSTGKRIKRIIRFSERLIYLYVFTSRGEFIVSV